ncbi:sulfotransferase domain-containing protein [Paraglaciecola sp. T6c]|uniref:sulfotransferase domain-containing protein n=1 Tax=Pseudoalteromonas atlantica (strain T6c / ATCC BAA-1087) TaxID=3042615 RepID=UPI0002EC4D49|nr:sulfotransferase domain-containing protein [Paraglaciecola sp. T6c]
MSSSVKLISGIPRSGTTLCCNLLNQRNDMVALHEPINPSLFPDKCTPFEASHLIAKQIYQFDLAIEKGQPFSHGDKGGLDIDNPVGKHAIAGVRQVVAKRGEVQLPPRDKISYHLIVKQNALFTALIPQLIQQFSILCIVRNPVDVLLSWFTVDLPVNRGHIPAGERFDEALRLSLQDKDCLGRQLSIYQWFISRFMQSGLTCIRYEDVVATNGAVLDEALALPIQARETLSEQSRTFSAATLDTLKEAVPHLLTLDCGKYYNKDAIATALERKGIKI